MMITTALRSLARVTTASYRSSLSLRVYRSTPSLWSTTSSIQTRFRSQAAVMDAVLTTNTAQFDKELPIVKVTDQCKDKIRNEGDNTVLRVVVDGGGCSGFQYRFELETTNEIQEEDLVFDQDGTQIIIDPISIEFLDGATVDYENQLIRKGFMISDNPHASYSCGCGTSFTAV